MTTGQRIKHLREKIGKSQVELADMIGVSKQTLYKYENDIVTNIPLSKISAIAAATGATPDYIMGWEEPPTHNAAPALAPDAENLLNNYLSCNPHGQKKISDYAADVARHPDYKKD